VRFKVRPFSESTHHCVTDNAFGIRRWSKIHWNLTSRVFSVEVVVNRPNQYVCLWRGAQSGGFQHIQHSTHFLSWIKSETQQRGAPATSELSRRICENLTSVTAGGSGPVEPLWPDTLLFVTGLTSDPLTYWPLFAACCCWYRSRRNWRTWRTTYIDRTAYYDHTKRRYYTINAATRLLPSSGLLPRLRRHRCYQEHRLRV